MIPVAASGCNVGGCRCFGHIHEDVSLILQEGMRLACVTKMGHVHVCEQIHRSVQTDMEKYRHVNLQKFLIASVTGSLQTVVCMICSAVVVSI